MQTPGAAVDQDQSSTASGKCFSERQVSDHEAALCNLQS